MSDKRAVVLEPHNDDFVIGIGGTGLQLLDSGWEVMSIVLTDGRFGSIDMNPERTKQVRSKEKAREADAIGTDYVEFAYPDQSLQSKYEDEARKIEVLDALLEVLERFEPSVIFVPAPSEGHPDHRAANRFARCLGDRYSNDLTIVEFVIWEIPFLSSVSETGEVLAVDVSEQFEEKCEAIRIHESQFRVYDYDDMVSDFNRYLANLYTHELEGAVAELLHVNDGPSFPEPLLGSIDARRVTSKFHEPS